MPQPQLIVRVGADVRDFQKGMSTTQRSLRGLDDSVSGLRGGLTRFSSLLNPVTAVAGAIGAVGIALTKSTKDAIAFESAFAGIRKTVETSEAGFKILSSEIKALSTRIPVAATELAGIGEIAGQLGVEAGNVANFTRVVADLGVASNLTGEQGATMIARFANITGTPQAQFENIASAIVDLGNNSATTEAEIAEMALRLASAGTQVGASAADVLGFSAALSSVGVNAEAGGTAFSQFFLRLQKDVANGAESLKGFSTIAGTDFAKAFREDATGAIVQFIEGLGRFKEAGGEMAVVFESLGINSVRLQNALGATALNSDGLSSSIARSNEAFDANVALQAEAAKRYATTESQLKLMSNQFTALTTEIGSGFTPAVGSAAKETASLLGDLTEIVKAANNVEPGFNSAGESVGKFTIQVLKAGTGLSNLRQGVKLMADEARALNIDQLVTAKLRDMTAAGAAAGLSQFNLRERVKETAAAIQEQDKFLAMVNAALGRTDGASSNAARGIAHLGDEFDNLRNDQGAVDAIQEQLNRTFAEAEKRAKALASEAGNLAPKLRAVGTAAKSTDEPLQTLARNAEDLAGQMEGVDRSAGDMTVSVGKTKEPLFQVSTIVTDLGAGLAKAALDGGGFVKVIKNMGEALLDAFVRSGIEAALGGIFEKLTGIFKISGGSGAGGGISIPGGGGGGGFGGGGGDPVTGAISAAANVGTFLGVRQIEGSLNFIEHNTRVSAIVERKELPLIKTHTEFAFRSLDTLKEIGWHANTLLASIAGQLADGISIAGGEVGVSGGPVSVAGVSTGTAARNARTRSGGTFTRAPLALGAGSTAGLPGRSPRGRGGMMPTRAQLAGTGNRSIFGDFGTTGPAGASARLDSVDPGLRGSLNDRRLELQQFAAQNAGSASFQLGAGISGKLLQSIDLSGIRTADNTDPLPKGLEDISAASVKASTTLETIAGKLDGINASIRALELSVTFEGTPLDRALATA